MKKLALAGTMIAVIAVIAAAPATAAAPTLAPHVFQTKITGAAVPALNAFWRLSTTRTGFIITRSGAPALAGTLAIAGNKVTFHDITGPFACRGAQATGTYGWRIVGARLTFTRIKDACVGRRTVLSHRFTRIA